MRVKKFMRIGQNWSLENLCDPSLCVKMFLVLICAHGVIIHMQYQTALSLHVLHVCQAYVYLASSPGSPIFFNARERKRGSLAGIQCHVHDVDPYARVGRVADRENCA
jgi:hypothetical protein